VIDRATDVAGCAARGIRRVDIRHLAIADGQYRNDTGNRRYKDASVVGVSAHLLGVGRRP